MAAPVWVLSVDLQTKTATFQSGMADAAKSARGAFTDIKSGSGEMGREVGGNMMEARHGVMLLGEEFGIHLPRALTTFIASIGPVGAAMEAAFPFLAIAVGATLLIEALVKMHEAGEKVTTDQVKFGTAVQNAFNSLDEKILQAGIRADELRNDHIGALKKQLELIDKQSMAELVHSFGEVAKAADVVFGDLKSHWYTFGIGSAGAKHALDEFQTKYDSLLAQGKDKDASDLLKGTRESAERVLALQQKAASTTGQASTAAAGGHANGEVLLQHEAALNDLKKSGVGFSEKEVTAQQTLVSALQSQEQIESRMAALKKIEKDNDTRTVGNEGAAKAAEAAREAAEHQKKMGEMQLAAEREQDQASLTMHQATIAERLATDISLADKEYAIQASANTALIGALDKAGKDYSNQLKALQDKALELTAQHENAVAALKAKAALEQYRKDLTDLEQSEREKIGATQQGSAARLAAIDAALKAEEARNLQNTSFYRELLNQKTETTRQAAEEEAKIQAEAGRLAAEQTQKMGELQLAAQKEQQQLIDSARRVSAQQRMQEEMQNANAEYALKLMALKQEAAALDKGGKDYQNKLRELQDKEKQLVQQHENEITAIKDKAEEERNQRILSAENRFNDEISRGLTQVLMRHKSFAAAMDQIGSQVVAGMLENAIKSALMDDFTKEKDAAAAARKAFLWGWNNGGPAAPVLAPTLAAVAFAAVMAFEGGTDMVPGTGRGDVVPAMLTPGEGVVPGGVMDGLRNLARNGGFGGAPTQQVHFAPQYHLSALDSGGMENVLNTHAPVLQKHFETALRKMNR